jgi:phage terminase large subunit-like protein
VARPTKSLAEHVRDGSFRADRHAGLLLGPLLADEELAGLQSAYRTAAGDEEARLVAIMFAGRTREPRGQAPRLAPGPAQSGEGVAEFFEHNLMHAKGPKAGEPFRLEPWQREFVDEFYKRDEEGRRVYRLGILGVPRGNGKSPLAAGLALYELLTRADSPDVFCAAGSRDQARIVFTFARSFVETGSLLDSVRVGRNELVYPDAAGSLRVISSEGALQFGHSVSCAIIDEAHVFKSAKQADLWTSMETALHKRVDSFLLAITTAGHDKLTTLGRLYDTALEQLELEQPHDCFTIGRDEDNGVLLWWYGAPEDADVDDEGVWRRCNPASWVSMRDLRRQRNSPGTSEASFRRLHLNSWTAGTEEGRWIDPPVWATLADLNRPYRRVPPSR